MKAIIIMGSTADEPHAKKITAKLDEYKINWEQHAASAHKQPLEVLKILEKPKLGVNRIVWNFRLTPQSNIKLKNSEPGRYSESNSGPLALPGTYYITMHKVESGKSSLLVDKTSFNCKWLDQISIPADNKEDLLSFQQKVDRLRKAIDAAGEIMDENKQRINFPWTFKKSLLTKGKCLSKSKIKYGK